MDIFHYMQLHAFACIWKVDKSTLMHANIKYYMYAEELKFYFLNLIFGLRTRTVTCNVFENSTCQMHSAYSAWESDSCSILPIGQMVLVHTAMTWLGSWNSWWYCGERPLQNSVTVGVVQPWIFTWITNGTRGRGPQLKEKGFLVPCPNKISKF